MSDSFPIRFNLADAQIQRGLQKNQLDINKTLERLSTGLRVNRAADDPVGLSIAKKLETRLLSQNQAIDNLREASLVAGTASEGAQQILEGLKQIRSLTLNSLNDTSTLADRERFQSDLKALVEQIDKLARSTVFNDRNLLDGSSSAPVLFRPAESKILFNRTVTDTSAGTPVSVPFISGIVSTDPAITQDSVVEFRLFDSGAEFSAGLEIRSSRLGLIATTNNYLAFPNTYDVPTESLTGGPVVRVSLANLGFNQPEALSLNEYQNVSLQQLVDDRRIRPVSYGNLNLTLGGVAYNGVFNVQSNQTLEDVVNGLNGASVGTGSLSASYDVSSSRVTLSYSNQRSVQESTTTAYSPAIPTDSGAPVANFAGVNVASEGPGYRDPDSFLPSAPFSQAGPPPGTVFPNIPVSLNTALDFSGTDAGLLAALGLSNVADPELVTGYESTYQGVTVATGNQSEYVNRTQVTIDAVSSSNIEEGSNTGLDATDANTALAALTTPQVDVSAFGAGDFTVNFGANGLYTFAGFDPATNTIQDVLDGINNYATSTGANVSASFDSGSNQLVLSNAPAAKVTDPGFVAGEFTIDFGVNGTFDSATDLGGFDPLTQSIGDIVGALNNFATANGVSVAASYDDVNDRFTLTSDIPSGAGLNQIVFGGANGGAIQDFFNIASDAGGAVDSVSLTSSADIDNSAVNTAYDITAADVTAATLSSLVAPSGDNQIVLGGINGPNLQAFFRLSDVPDTSTSVPQSSTSAGDISAQSVDATLDISAADVSGRTLEQLFTPRLATGPLSGPLVINGQTALTVGNSTTLNDIVNAVSGLLGTSNRSYSANFDAAVAGGLQIQVQDRELLSPPAFGLGADPSGATPQVNGNQITLDSAAYIAAEAPLTYNAGTPLGTGSGPAEQLTFQSAALSGQYVVNAPDPASEDISGIQFSGSNIGTVLNLQNTATGAPSVVVGSDLYRGTIAATGTNSYDLTAEYQRDFSATSSVTSSRAIGFETPIGQEADFGVVGEIFIRANQAIVSEDRALVIQSGPDAGDTRRLGINELTAAALRLESLTLVGADDRQTRLLGLETLNVLDDAIDATLGTLAGLGSSQSLLEQAISGSQQQRENLQQALSQTQDADITTEISNLTRAQINVQAAAFALSENRDIQQRTFDLLFNRFGEIRLRDL